MTNTTCNWCEEKEATTPATQGSEEMVYCADCQNYLIEAGHSHKDAEGRTVIDPFYEG